MYFGDDFGDDFRDEFGDHLRNDIRNCTPEMISEMISGIISEIISEIALPSFHNLRYLLVCSILNLNQPKMFKSLRYYNCSRKEIVGSLSKSQPACQWKNQHSFLNLYVGD